MIAEARSSIRFLVIVTPITRTTGFEEVSGSGAPIVDDWRSIDWMIYRAPTSRNGFAPAKGHQYRKDTPSCESSDHPCWFWVSHSLLLSSYRSRVFSQGLVCSPAIDRKYARIPQVFHKNWYLKFV